MKLFPHCPGWLTIAAFLSLSVLARAQPIEGEIKGFKHAFVDEKTGKRTMLLSGGSVTNISNEELLLRDGVRLQFFDEAGKTSLEVASPRCIYNTRTESVSSTNHLEASSGRGQFSLEGDGFEYARANGSLTISNRVHAIIRKDLLEPPSQTNAPRSAVPPGMQTNAAPATSQFMHIFSDHMRYQTNFAVFDQNVRLEDPQGEVTCGSLSVAFSQPSQTDERRRVENILAERHVVIDSEEIHAGGERARYRLTTEVVELRGNPTWRLRQYEGRAEELVVNRKRREFRALRDVEMTLPPGSIGPTGFLPPESPPPPNAATSKPQPVMVRAEDFEFKPDAANTNFNVAEFRGRVRADSGKGILGCELMTIRSSASSNRTESVVAERGVVMEQGGRRATGDKAVYTAATDTVEVTGHPAWKAGEQEGTAEILAFNLKDNVYRASRNVAMRLPPGSFGRAPWLLPPSEPETNATVSAGVPTTRRPGRPVEISSDEFEFQSAPTGAKTDTALYQGRVLVNDPDRMKLSCERLTGKMLSGTNHMESVVAEGNVSIDIQESEGERRAQGDQAVYTASEGTVALTGRDGVKIVFVDPKIEGLGTGAKMVYAANQDVLELTGNPMLTTPQGQVSGEVVILDRASTTLKATGYWKMKLNSEALKKKATPTSPKSRS